MKENETYVLEQIFEEITEDQMEKIIQFYKLSLD